MSQVYATDFQMMSHKLALLREMHTSKNNGGGLMSQVYKINHPIILHKLALLRDKNTGTKLFKELLKEIAMLMTYEVTKEFETKEVEVETPICKTKCRVLDGKKTAIVPILRAGLGMVEGVLSIIPFAKVGHIGMSRDEENLKPVEYYCKLPRDINEREVILVDPMLATGGSAIDAVNSLKKYGAKKIKFMCIIAAPEGIINFRKVHPDIDIYVASIDDCLNEKGYIVPGLGDAGDRIFGTL